MERKTFFVYVSTIPTSVHTSIDKPIDTCPRKPLTFLRPLFFFPVVTEPPTTTTPLLVTNTVNSLRFSNTSFRTEFPPLFEGLSDKKPTGVSTLIPTFRIGTIYVGRVINDVGNTSIPWTMEVSTVLVKSIHEEVIKVTKV